MTTHRRPNKMTSVTAGCRRQPGGARPALGDAVLSRGHETVRPVVRHDGPGRTARRAVTRSRPERLDRGSRVCRGALRLNSQTITNQTSRDYAEALDLMQQSALIRSGPHRPSPCTWLLDPMFGERESPVPGPRTATGMPASCLANVHVPLRFVHGRARGSCSCFWPCKTPR